jgi:hypothetical protein
MFIILPTTIKINNELENIRFLILSQLHQKTPLPLLILIVILIILIINLIIFNYYIFLVKPKKNRKY